jgi:hypothetical protein
VPGPFAASRSARIVWPAPPGTRVSQTRRDQHHPAGIECLRQLVLHPGHHPADVKLVADSGDQLAGIERVSHPASHVGRDLASVERIGELPAKGVHHAVRIHRIRDLLLDGGYHLACIERFRQPVLHARACSGSIECLSNDLRRVHRTHRFLLPGAASRCP